MNGIKPPAPAIAPSPVSRPELLREAEAQRALADLFPHLKLDALRAIQDLFPLQAQTRPASRSGWH
jgi:hypothetical protein